MGSPDAGALRLMRAAALGSSAFALALAAHVAAGGVAPSLMASLILLGGSIWVSIFVTWGRLGRLTVISALGGSQVALHQLFEWATPMGSCMRVVHSHVDRLTNGATTICSHGATASAHPSHGGLAMTAAHVLAAGLIGLLLARGEAAVWFLAQLVWPRVPTQTTLQRFSGAGALVRSAQWFVRPTTASGAGDRRGPPVWELAHPATALQHWPSRSSLG